MPPPPPPSANPWERPSTPSAEAKNSLTRQNGTGKWGMLHTLMPKAPSILPSTLDPEVQTFLEHLLEGDRSSKNA